MSQFRIIIASLLAGVLLCASLLAPTASLHRALHADCHTQTAACFLCSLSQGKLDQAEPGLVWVCWQAAPSAAPIWAAAVVRTVAAAGLPPGRAPPVSRPFPLG